MKIILILLLMLVVPACAELSAHEIDVITVRHVNDTSIQMNLYLNDKDGMGIASSGELTISILGESPAYGPSIVGQQVSGVDTVYVMDYVGKISKVHLDEKPPKKDTDPEIFNRTYQINKTAFSTTPYVSWRSPEIKYYEFDRAPTGGKFWVTASFRTPDGRLLNYDRYFEVVY